ncbi:MAG: AAA family ATPase, partial [bacterium]|nr:AAA family ATPase [bacterium]
MKPILNFFEWYLERAPISQFYFITNFLRSMEDILGISVNIKYFFASIFGDKSWLGRFLTFIFRTAIIICGTIILTTVSIILLFIPIIWFFGVFFAYYYPLLITIPLITIIYYALHSNASPKKINPLNISTIELLNYTDHDTSVLLDQYQTADFYRSLETNLQVIQFKHRLQLSSINFGEILSNSSHFIIDDLLNSLQNLSSTHNIRYFRPTHIFYCILILNQRQLSQTLLDNKLDIQLLDKYLSWDEYEYTLKHPPQFWDKDYKVYTGGGTNRTWQGTITPILNEISNDLTANPQVLHKQVYRTELISQVEEALSKTENSNVILMGDIGVGKKTLVKQIADIINYGQAKGPLWSKRIVELNIGQLYSNSGTDRGGFESKVESLIKEISNSGNIILFIDDFQSAVETGSPSGLSLFTLLQSPLTHHQLHIIGALTPREYKEVENKNSSFLKQFTLIKVSDTSKEQSTHIVHTECIKLEQIHSLFFPYATIDSIVGYSDIYIHDVGLPQKALDLLEDIIVHTENSHILPNIQTTSGPKILINE